MESASEPVVGNAGPDPLLEGLGVHVGTDNQLPRHAPAGAPKSGSHLKEIPALDGWRGISILLVLATHMLPLGLKRWQLNWCTGAAGMSLFFTLSGFLITGGLLKNSNVPTFFIRRFCRIVPLAYLYFAIALFILGKSPGYYVSSFLFLINYDYAHITHLTSHLWSLCVEMHFYIFVGILVLLIGRKGLYFLPLLAGAVTVTRIFHHVLISIQTHLRVDEILAGACLALCYYHPKGKKTFGFLAPSWLPFPLMLLLMICSHPLAGPMDYARPYVAAALVGSTLWSAGTTLHRILASRLLRYIATVSYALYVIHPLTMYGWLNTGGVFKKYLIKRPISFAITFIAAHLSTFYYEKRWILHGKALAARINEHRQSHRTIIATIQD